MRKSRAVLALIAVGVVLLGLVALRTTSGPDYGNAAENSNVVVIGVAGLSWEDISETSTPQLWKAANNGASGVITTRAARSVTCPWDGWVTLGAGNRARYPAPVPEDEVPPEGELSGPDDGNAAPGSSGPDPLTDAQSAVVAGCLAQQGRPPTSGGTQLDPAIAENDKLGFGAEPGSLGGAVPCTTVVGEEPVLAVGASGADVRPVAAPTTTDGWRDISERCPLTLVQAPAVIGAASSQLSALDKSVGMILDGARSGGATVIVVGIAQSEYRSATLHPIIAVGSGLQGKVLSAPSTGRTPFLQLIDVAPTVLSILGQSVPSDMTGQVMTTEPREMSLADAVTGYRDDEVAAAAHLWISKAFFLALSIVCLLGSIFVFLAVRVWLRLRRYAAPTAIVVGLIPAASFLANILPWWRVGNPGLALLGAVVLTLAVLSGIALLGPWRGHVSGPALCAAALTAGVLGADVLTGSHLQLNSPLGYDAIVAGRFTGFGNIAFAVFAAAALLVVGAATALTDGSARKIGAVVAVLGLATIALDGAPRVGADFGGVIALFPGLLLLAMIAAWIRISMSRLLLALVGGGVLVGVIAVLDYLRPAASRTHLGRFVGQVLNGTALTVVERKLKANLHLITSSVLTLLVIGLVVVLILLWRDKNGVARQYVFDRSPYALAALVGVGVMAVVGFAVNDSGIAVVAGALMVAVPLLLATLARLPVPSAEPAPSADDHTSAQS